MSFLPNCPRKATIGLYMLAAAFAVGTLALFVLPAIAGFPTLGIEKAARKVSDEELGDMRGKYIAPESVNFFGIQLMSSWQTGDGVVLSAALSFGSEIKNGQFQNDPKLMAAWLHGCDTCGDESVNIQDGGTPQVTQLAAINGAVQITKVAGDDNRVTNVMNVRISADAGENFAPSITGDPVSQGQEKTVTFNDGSAAKFQFEYKAIGLILNGPGAAHSADGVVMQGFFGNQLTQNVNLMGNANMIANTFDIMVGVDPAILTELSAQNALSAMQGWGF